MSEFKQSDLIQTTLEGVKDVLDANTVLGKPYVTGGTTIIPVTRVSVGLASGGLDYFGKNAPTADKHDPSKYLSFGGGGGTGVSVSPVGFLIIKASGSVELLTVDSVANRSAAVNIIDTVLDVIDRSPEIADKLKAVVAKFKSEKKEKEEDAGEN